MPDPIPMRSWVARCLWNGRKEFYCGSFPLMMQAAAIQWGGYAERHEQETSSCA